VGERAAPELAFASELYAPSGEVWSFVSTMRGVNHELFPLLRMTYPRAFGRRSLDEAPLGRRVFRSWLLLGGVVPVDYDDLTFAELTPGEGFLETSTMLTQRAWRHERRLGPSPRGCVLIDRVAYEPRLRALGPPFGLATAALFRHRHRRLRAKFGGTALEPDAIGRP
jgi:ligand-binding SRPBCC domain-containing protein